MKWFSELKIFEGQRSLGWGLEAGEEGAGHNSNVVRQTQWRLWVMAVKYVLWYAAI